VAPSGAGIPVGRIEHQIRGDDPWSPTVNRQARARLEPQLRRLVVGEPPAILLGDGSTNDLSFVRSLSRHGVPTILIAGRRLLGSFSRHGVRFRMPPVEDEPQAWLDLLDEVASVLGGSPVLFALSDAHCAFVSRNAGRLSRSFRFLLPDEETMSRILDKRRQYAAAEDAGIRVPLTFYPEDGADLVRLASEIDYPVILKPRTAHVGRPKISNRKVVVLRSATELISAWFECATSGARFMVQAIVAGGDDAIFWYSGFWDEQCRERAWFTVQKLRQFPPRFGDGSFQRTVEAPEVLRLSRRLLETFRYRGLVMVEFKRDARNGIWYLMEINPRTVSGNQLGVTAGVDLPWIAYRRLIGREPTEAPPPPFRRDVQYVNEEWDAQAFAALRRSGELTLVDWLRSLRGTRAWALFAWDDPLPLLVGLWRFLRIRVRRTIRR
jgi:predicted ATP-grasp superfamily ATP-dependent carboligase